MPDSENAVLLPPAPALDATDGIDGIGGLDDDVPPAGTPCAGCKQLGHWCAAKCYRGESTALCRACANGVDCSVVEAKLAARYDDFEVCRYDMPVAPVRSLTPTDAEHRVVVETPPKRLLPYTPSIEELHVRPRGLQRERYSRPAPVLPPVRIIAATKKAAAPAIEPQVETKKEPEVKAKATPLTEEQLELIRTAPDSETTADLAKRIGANESACWYRRNQFRKQKVKAGAFKKAVAAKPPAPVRQPQPSSTAIDIVGVAQRVHALAPSRNDAEGITVSVTFTSPGMDAWWGKLSLAEKAKIALANITF